MTIKATIIADSISASTDKRITSLELELPRFIWSEMLTHRLFSRNAASSRAIPVSKVTEQVRSNPAKPMYWGSSKSGMQAGSELTGEHKALARGIWETAAIKAAEFSDQLFESGLHKQHTNRITEPFQQYKVVLTATEFDNFFYLRNHKDAQPEIRMLAQAMLEAMKASTPMKLKTGEWHLPYIKRKLVDGTMCYYDVNNTELTLEEAQQVSSSCCAQVSYRLLDHTLDKAKFIYDKLVNSKPVHASPFEHQATPMYWFATNDIWPEGVTHMDADGKFWSGNLQGFIQYRQLIKDNVCNNYEG